MQARPPSISSNPPLRPVRSQQVLNHVPSHAHDPTTSACATTVFYLSSVPTTSNPKHPPYNQANPATNPPATAPTTPGKFATAAAVLCAGADALAVTDELLKLKLELEVRDALCDSDTERLNVGNMECEVELRADCDASDAWDDETWDAELPDEVLERMNVGVCVNVGTGSVSVGIAVGRVVGSAVGKTRESGPKWGAAEASNNGPLAVYKRQHVCFYHATWIMRVRKESVPFVSCATTAATTADNKYTTRTMVSGAFQV